MKSLMPQAKNSNQKQHNTLEKVNSFEQSSSLFDQLLGAKNEARKATEHAPEKPPSFGGMRKEFTLFTHSNYEQNELIPRQIENLKQEIQQEMKRLKAANKALEQEAVEIEKAAMQTSATESGVYQVRFLELLLSMIRDMRAKAGEAGTWMRALQSKKKKRGSLFAANTKKKGTAYSQSQELQSTRSIQ